MYLILRQLYRYMYLILQVSRYMKQIGARLGSASLVLPLWSYGAGFCVHGCVLVVNLTHYPRLYRYYSTSTGPLVDF